jgi:hypothetical protein
LFCGTYHLGSEKKLIRDIRAISERIDKHKLEPKKFINIDNLKNIGKSRKSRKSMRNQRYLQD